MAQRLQVALLVHYVEQRRIVFVDQHHHLPARLLVGSLNQSSQTLVGIHLVGGSFPIDRLILRQFIAQLQFQIGLIKMLGRAHVEPQHRVAGPLPLQSLNGQSFEQLLASLEIGLQRGDQQRLAEAAGAAQEYILRRSMSQLIDKVGLIHIQVILLSQFREGLDAHRATLQLLSFHNRSDLFCYRCEDRKNNRYNNPYDQKVTGGEAKRIRQIDTKP